MTIIDALRMTKAAVQSEQKLHRCSMEQWKILQNEISEIDYLIIRQERNEERRKNTYEKRHRISKGMHDTEIRRRIYLGLRLDPVGTNRNVSPFRHGFRSMTAKRKGG